MKWISRVYFTFSVDSNNITLSKQCYLKLWKFHDFNVVIRLSDFKLDQK